jgi:hypothetical protein
LPRDSSIDVLEWLLAWPAFGMALLSCVPVIAPVGLLADVSRASPLVEDGDEVIGADDVPEFAGAEVSGVAGVPVGVLGAVLGVPAPVGLSGTAGSGGGVDWLVDGVTGGTALVSG